MVAHFDDHLIDSIANLTPDGCKSKNLAQYSTQKSKGDTFTTAMQPSKF